MTVRIIAATVMVLLLAGCSSAPARLAPSPAATPTASSAATPKPAPTAVIDVPVQGSELTAPVATVPPVRIRVPSVQNVEKKQLPLDQVFDRDGAPRLVLITCGGQFDENVLNYSDNIIVIANPA